MSDEVTVDVNTDDLDAFTELFNGKAAEKVVEAEAPADDTGATEVEADAEEIEVEVEADAEIDAEIDEAKEEDEDILKPKPKKKQTVQERINELTRKAHEAERREAEALRRLTAAEAERNSKIAEPTHEAPQAIGGIEPGSPDVNSLHGDGSLVYPLGEFDPLFIRDLTRFHVQKENERVTAHRFEQESRSREEAAALKLQENWAGKLTEVEKELPDLRPVIATLESELRHVDPTLGTYLAQTIMGMDVGPQVLYYLANNVDEAQKIIAAGPVNATLALGRLEQRIQESQAKKASPTARVSAAPQPPVLTRGTASRSVVADDTDDLEAFEAKFFSRK